MHETVNQTVQHANSVIQSWQHANWAVQILHCSNQVQIAAGCCVRDSLGDFVMAHSDWCR